MEGPLLERESELQTLSAAVRGAATGDGVCVVVEGPPGTGKTSLLDGVRALAADAGVSVMGARVAGPAFPFGLALSLFEKQLQHWGTDDGLFRGSAALARPFLIGGLLPSGAPGPSRTALVHALARVVTNLAHRRPLLLAIDDADLGDPATLEVLAVLADGFDPPPCSLVVAARPPLGVAEAALHRLRAARWSQVLTLRPFSEAATAEALHGQVHGVGPETCAALHTAAGGSPLLVQAMAADLTAVGGGREAVARIQAGVTPVVQAAVAAWVAGLPPVARRLANSLAVVGPAADSTLACTTGDLDLDDLTTAVPFLAQAGILSADGDLRFTCPLIGQAIYSGLPVAERTVMHAAAATALAERRAGAPALAAHLAAQPPAGSGETVQVLREAAAALLEDGEVTSAVTYLRRALDEPVAPEHRPGLLAELGRAEAAVDPASAAAHLQTAASASTCPDERARLLVDAAHALRLHGRLEEATSALEEASEILPESAVPLAREIEAGLRAVRRHHRRTRIDPPAVQGMLDRHRRGETLPPALMAELAFDAALAAVDANEVRTLARRALDGQVQGAGAENTTLFDAAMALAFTDDLDEAAALFSAALQSATNHGAVLAAATARYRRGQTRFRQGRLPEAAADLEAALTAVPDGWRVHVAGATATLALVHIHCGDMDAARAALDALPEGESWHRLQPFVLHVQGLLRLAEGSPAGAVHIFDRMARVEEQTTGAINPGVLPWRASAAFALAMLDRRVDAKAMADEDFELAVSFGTPRAVGVALRTLAFSREGSERISLLRRSREVLEASPAPLEQAWTALALGTGLRAAGQRQEAVDVLRSAQDIAVRCGAMLTTQLALAELSAAGRRPRRLAVTGPDSLTPSERRCAELAVAGRSNREIAQELFVTLKAVEWHLGNTYRKLQVRGRRDLRAVLPAC